MFSTSTSTSEELIMLNLLQSQTDTTTNIYHELVGENQSKTLVMSLLPNGFILFHSLLPINLELEGEFKIYNGYETSIVSISTIQELLNLPNCLVVNENQRPNTIEEFEELIFQDNRFKDYVPEQDYQIYNHGELFYFRSLISNLNIMYSLENQVWTLSYDKTIKQGMTIYQILS